MKHKPIQYIPAGEFMAYAERAYAANKTLMKKLAKM